MVLGEKGRCRGIVVRLNQGCFNVNGLLCWEKVCRYESDYGKERARFIYSIWQQY